MINEKRTERREQAGGVHTRHGYIKIITFHGNWVRHLFGQRNTLQYLTIDKVMT